MKLIDFIAFIDFCREKCKIFVEKNDEELLSIFFKGNYDLDQLRKSMCLDTKGELTKKKKN